MFVSPLVIINDINVISIAIFKAETYAPLVVNANAPLAGAIMSQRSPVYWKAGCVNRRGMCAPSNWVNRIAARFSISCGKRVIFRWQRSVPFRKRQTTESWENNKQFVYYCQVALYCTPAVVTIVTVHSESGFTTAVTLAKCEIPIRGQTGCKHHHVDISMLPPGVRLSVCRFKPKRLNNVTKRCVLHQAFGP